MVAVIAAIIFSLLVPVTSESSDCADVYVIGARGSGQPAGYGDQVAPAVDAIVSTLSGSGLDVAPEPLDYPAISVSDSFGLVLLTGDYARSVQAGAIELIARLARISSACPESDIVLVGYSQGAQVIKTALDGVPPRYRISSIVLLADPTRDPSQAGIVRLGDPSVERTGSFGPIGLADHLRAVAIDVCADGDGVCERGRSSLVAHTEGYAGAGAWIAPVVAAEFADRLRNLSGIR
ncbi:MAG: cutinase family protein [Acidimicrobiia bacterium]|nr:cutinase family protein [Acidimicrobiia bacterium]